MRRCSLNPRCPRANLVMIAWVFALCTVVVGCLTPAATLHRIHYDDLGLNDKLVHFTSYMVLASLPVTFLEWIGTGAVSCGCLIILGGCIEFLQKLVPGRSCELGDMIANSLGVSAGLLIALLVRSGLNRSAARQVAQENPSPTSCGITE